MRVIILISKDNILHILYITSIVLSLVLIVHLISRYLLPLFISAYFNLELHTLYLSNNMHVFYIIKYKLSSFSKPNIKYFQEFIIATSSFILIYILYFFSSLNIIIIFLELKHAITIFR